MNTNYIIALLFLLLEVIVIIKNYDIKKNYNTIWFCDFAPFLFAIGFFFSNIQFLKAIISVGLLGQTITLITFVPSRVLEWSRDTAKHRKIYIFVDIFSHLTTIIVLVLIFPFPPEVESFKYSFFIIISMFFITLIFTPKEENVNVIYHSQISSKKRNTKLKLPGHTVLWIFYMCIVALLTFWIQYLIYLYV